MKYKDFQIEIQKDVFGEEKLYGNFMKKEREFVLNNNKDNFTSIDSKEVIGYFEKNGINWWQGKQPTGHTLSSQIACLNHLFGIRKNPDAVLALAQAICPSLDSVEILENDKKETQGYISFEVVSDIDHLNEKKGKNKKLTRGSQCTSIDALILARKGNKRVLLVIEWKYVESYGNTDKSKNTKDKKDGDHRLENYTGEKGVVENPCLIQNSIQLKNLKNYKGSVYFYEPFYQLMRQTLWAEQMIKNNSTETIKADDYIHVHVVPKGNKELLDKIYISDKNMEDTWRDYIKDTSKYVLISPDDLLAGLPKEYEDLKDSLYKRYWR